THLVGQRRHQVRFARACRSVEVKRVHNALPAAGAETGSNLAHGRMSRAVFRRYHEAGEGQRSGSILPSLKPGKTGDPELQLTTEPRLTRNSGSLNSWPFVVPPSGGFPPRRISSTVLRNTSLIIAKKAQDVKHIQMSVSLYQSIT